MAVKMNFTVTECVPVDPAQNLYRARISIELRDNNQPLDGAVTIKAPNKEEMMITTDPGRGTGSGEFVFISEAAVAVLTAESRSGGNLLTARQPVTLKAKTTKSVPDRFTARAAGSNGKYVFIVGVIDKDNAAVEGVPVRVIKETTGEEVVNGTTNKHGSFISQEITFNESTCNFVVVVGALDPVQLDLEGPSRWRKAPPVPEPDPADLEGGIGNIIKNAFCRGSRDLKGGTP